MKTVGCFFQPKLFFRSSLNAITSHGILKIARSILPLNSDGYAANENDVHFTAFKVIETEAVLSFVTVLFAPVSNVFKNIETNYGLVIETKVQGETISINKCVGEGDRAQRRKNNTNHVIKYFPGKPMGIGRGRGREANFN